jgi:hypothetical protein
MYTSFYTTTCFYGTAGILNRVVRIQRLDDKKIKQELEKVTCVLKLKAEKKNGQFEDKTICKLITASN